VNRPLRAIVTGHSKGLGQALASELLSRGFDVLGLSRSHSADVTGLRQVTIDLSDSAALLAWIESGSLKAFVGDAEQAVVVNNAGVVSPVKPLGKQANVEIARAVELNISVPLILSNAFIAASDEVPDRRIMHISSGAGRVGYAGWSVYCATKAALDHHARAVHEDAITNLRISSLAPGVIDTGMQEDLRACSADDFPDIARFRDLKTSGQLASPGATAATVVDALLSDSFGQKLVSDVRDP